MKKLIAIGLMAVLAACNPGATTWEASEHNEDSNHQRDRTTVATPDTVVRNNADSTAGVR